MTTPRSVCITASKLVGAACVNKRDSKQGGKQDSKRGNGRMETRGQARTTLANERGDTLVEALIAILIAALAAAALATMVMAAMNTATTSERFQDEVYAAQSNMVASGDFNSVRITAGSVSESVDVQEYASSGDGDYTLYRYEPEPKEVAP